MSAYMSDDDGASSPDPLAISPDEHITKQTRKPGRRISAPLAKRSQNIQPISPVPSPTKSIILNTPKAAGASPWKIKVTVEAEPQFDASDAENSGSPKKTRRTRTTTTTVPLKGPDESSPVKRRGRPRKSDGAVVTKGKRNGTPVKRRVRSSRKSVVEEEESMVDVDAQELQATEPPKKGRGRPRKSLDVVDVKESARLPAAREVPGLGEVTRAAYESESSAEPPDDFPSQARMEEPAVIDVPEEAQQAQPRKPFDFTNLTPLHHKHVFPSPKRPSPETPRDPTPRINPLKFRKATPPRPTSKASAGYLPFTPSPDKQLPEVTPTPHRLAYLSLQSGPYPVSRSAKRLKNLQTKAAHPFHEQPYVPLGEESTAQKGEQCTKSLEPKNSAPFEPDDRTENLPSPVFATPPENENDPEPSEGEDDDSEDHDSLSQAVAGAEAEDTIMQSEGFSMVSIDSLPNRQAMLSSPAGTPGQEAYGAVRGQLHHMSLHSLSGEHAVDIEATRVVRTNNTPSYIDSPQLQPSSPGDPSYVLISPTPSQPPAPQVFKHGPPKTSTPRLAKIVSTGIALQGVLDTTTGYSPAKTPSVQKTRLDNLFSGFGEGTQRELRAGLRLGEQLAERLQQHRESAIPTPLPSQASLEGNLEGDVSSTRDETGRVDYPRLPTPEEQDGDDNPLPTLSATKAPNEFGRLNTKMTQAQLVSPARSTVSDAMSWQPSTPPSTKSNTSASQDEESILEQRKVVKETRHVPASKAPSDERPRVNRRLQDFPHQPKITSKPTPPAEAFTAQTDEELGDIWEEEASRSSDVQEKGKSPQLEDLFADEPLKPRRSKLPKTWRRKSSSNFQYSDEAEPETSSPAGKVLEQPVGHHTIMIPLKDAHEVSPREQESSSEDSTLLTPESDEDGDDETGISETGIYWRRERPAVPTKDEGPTAEDQSKSTKLDLSLLLGVHNTSLQLSPPKDRHRSSLIKSSPPEHPATIEISSDEEEEDVSSEETSEVPTSIGQADEEGVEDTMASDVRQLHAEMSHHPQISKAQPGMSQTLQGPDETITSVQASLSSISRTSGRKHDIVSATELQLPASEPTPKVEAGPAPAPAPASSFFTRLTTALFSTVLPPTSVSSAPQPPPSHPLTHLHAPLPRHQPWTKTHYKTLDSLYQSLKRTPHLFDPSLLSNAALLEDRQNKPRLIEYVGTRFGNWGYEAEVTGEWMVLVGAFLQLLSLDSHADYERVAGRPIDVGRILERRREGDGGVLVVERVAEVMAGWPGEEGDVIGPETVVRRLWSVVCGEMVRRDERRGVQVRRTPGTFWVEWPGRK